MSMGNEYEHEYEYEYEYGGASGCRKIRAERQTLS